jgi:Rha family phage regulatory protein
MTKLAATDQNLVFIKNEEPMTTSIKVAEVFGKNHWDVIRAIRKKTNNLPKTFTESNFALSNYVDETGKSNPMYELTKDGFAILAFGFTGSRAGEFQVAFLNEFNRRGEVLRKMQQHKLPKSKRKNRHHFAFYRSDMTPNGIGTTELITGVKTIEEMNEVEKLSWLQAKRVRLAQGIIKKYISDLQEEEQYQDCWVDLLDLLEDRRLRHPVRHQGPFLLQRPLFNDDFLESEDLSEDEFGGSQRVSERSALSCL